MRKRRINRRIIKWTYRNSPVYAFAAATGCALAMHGHQPDVIATLNALWAIYLREEFDKQNQPGSFLEFSRRCGGGAPTGPRMIRSRRSEIGDRRSEIQPRHLTSDFRLTNLEEPR